MLGGAGGDYFEDKVTSANLRTVVIRCGKELDGLQCEYDNGHSTYHHGGLGGREYFFYLDKDDAIITVNIWAGWRIDAIQFQTIKGQLSDKFGGGGGHPYVCRGFHGRERALMGFKGRSGYGINELEPIWSTARDLGNASVSVGEFRGGYGGAQFNMLQAVRDPLTTVLRTIVVSSNWRIDAVQCIFQDNKKSEYQGGRGGTDHRFELGANERVVRIEGRSDEKIYQLQFVTNLQRHSEKFGRSNEGTPFVWTPPFGGGNMSLLCFQGRSGWEVDRLAPVWAVDPPIKFQLDITDFDKPTASMIGSPEEAWTASQSTDNHLSTAMKSEFTWTRAATKSTTISLSEQSRSKVGGKFTMEVTVGGSVGIPVLAEGKVSIKVGIEVSGEHEWGKSVTDSTALTHSFTESLKQEITIPARTRCTGEAVGYKYQVNGLKWSGVMTLTYAGGDTKHFDVQGSFDSVSSVQIHTKYREEKIPANK